MNPSRPPTLADLPPPPPHRQGWPWTTAPPRLPDSADLSTITVITPSYNQGEFIEETIRSVLLQGHPRLQYLILDGGSTDKTLDVIRRYERWIDFWTSEPDRGQADAISKGLQRCTGTICNWINSDDLLLPGCLALVAGAFSPDVDAVAGACLNFGGGQPDNVLSNRRLSARSLLRGTRGAVFQQPAFWFRPALLTAIGGLDTTMHHGFDFDMAIRYTARFPRVRYLPSTLAAFRRHPASKTATSPRRFLEDYRRTLVKIAEGEQPLWLKKVARLRLHELNLHSDIARLLEDSHRPVLSRFLTLAAWIARRPNPGTVAIALAAGRRLVSGRPWFMEPLPRWEKTGEIDKDPNNAPPAGRDRTG